MLGFLLESNPLYAFLQFGSCSNLHDFAVLSKIVRNTWGTNCTLPAFHFFQHDLQLLHFGIHFHLPVKLLFFSYAFL